MLTVRSYNKSTARVVEINNRKYSVYMNEAVKADGDKLVGYVNLTDEIVMSISTEDGKYVGRVSAYNAIPQNVSGANNFYEICGNHFVLTPPIKTPTDLVMAILKMNDIVNEGVKDYVFGEESIPMEVSWK